MSSQVVRITPGRLGAFIKANAVRQHKAFEAGVKIAKMRGVAHLKKLTPVDTGVMKNAWASTKYGIENSAPYAGIIERGARPHKVSREGVEAIRDWVIRKGFVTYEKSPGQVRVGGKGNKADGIEGGEYVYREGPSQLKRVNRKRYDENRGSQKAVDAIVWAIVNKLRTKGYKGKFFVEGSLDALTAMLDEEIGEQMARAIAGRDFFGRQV